MLIYITYIFVNIYNIYIYYLYNIVGKSTFDLANGMQHRLNKVIQQLKSG